MNTLFTLKLIAACALLAGAGGTFAQHSPAGHGADHGQASAASPYAGQQVRDIKALSADQTQDLLAGKGMELAKAAELNGYPGPMHTLELAQPLALTAAQKQATKELMDRHKADARRIGAELVDAERALDQAFASRRIDVASLKQHTARIAQLQAALRTSHLQTHLQQSALLTPQQIGRYAELRGYTGSATPSSPSIHKH
jgi:Spy/CpxP family protein refolding chaperone